MFTSCTPRSVPDALPIGEPAPVASVEAPRDEFARSIDRRRRRGPRGPVMVPGHSGDQCPGRRVRDRLYHVREYRSLLAAKIACGVGAAVGPLPARRPHLRLILYTQVEGAKGGQQPITTLRSRVDRKSVV